MDETSAETGGLATLLVLLGGTAAGMAADLWLDYREGTSAAHLLVEGVVMSLAAAGAGLLARELWRLRGEAAVRERLLDASRRDAERWRAEARHLLEGLGAAIDTEFERWKLTPAESEVGLLLMKGLSHKEIAGVRKVSERTVRQQARALYRKAGLTGRADLAAYFLEDLLLPARDPPDREPSS